MSKANLKVVTIEANNKEDAIRQLREQLDGNVPQHIIDKMVASVMEADQDIPARPTKQDVQDFAEKLARVPASERDKVLEDYIVDLGAKFGFGREEAIEKANGVKAKVENVLEALGIKMPEAARGPIGGKGETRKSPFEQIMDALNPEMRETAADVKDSFESSMEKLQASGVSEQQLCHIGQFYNHQDELVDSMQFLFHLADDHGHRPSAVLFQQIDDYINATNKWLYDTCDKAGVNPESFGFSTREDYAEKSNSLNRVRKSIAKVLDSKPAASFA
jgi:hypothetical protein